MRHLSLKLILAVSTLVTACTTSRPLPSDIAGFCFGETASSASRPSPEILQQAAEMTLRRGDSHFLMTRKQNAARPALNIGYGRSPYGFGDPGRSTPDSLSGGIEFAAPHEEWCVSWPENSHALKNAYDAKTVSGQAR